MNQERPESLSEGKDRYLRIDIASKISGHSIPKLYKFLRDDYAGMKMRWFKRGTMYVHEADLMKFKPMPHGNRHVYKESPNWKKHNKGKANMKRKKKRSGQAASNVANAVVVVAAAASMIM